MATTAKQLPKQWGELDEATKAKQKEMLEYIKSLAKASEVDISRWDVLGTFGAEDGPLLRTDIREINKAFAAKVSAITARRAGDADIDASVVQGISRLFNNNLARERRNIARTIENTESHIRRLSLDLDRFTQELRNERDKLNLIDNPEAALSRAREVTDAIRAVVAEGVWAAPIVEGDWLWFKTTQPAIMKFRRRSPKISADIDFGYWSIAFRLRNGAAVKLYPYGHNIVSGGYPHPHVMQGGGICWGNANEPVRRALSQHDIPQILVMAWNLLTTYGGNPYQDPTYFIEEDVRGRQDFNRYFRDYILYPNRHLEYERELRDIQLKKEEEARKKELEKERERAEQRRAQAEERSRARAALGVEAPHFEPLDQSSDDDPDDYYEGEDDYYEPDYDE